MEARALPRGGGRIKLRQSIAKSSAVSCRSVSHSRSARGRSIGAARNSGKTRPEERGLSFWDVPLIPRASEKFVGGAGSSSARASLDHFVGGPAEVAASQRAISGQVCRRVVVPKNKPDMRTSRDLRAEFLA